MPFDFHDCWFLTGPTASGKSAVAIELAKRIGAEIVSMDSMALYVGMDIGTAKPTVAERREIPHHLIDVLDPREEFSVAQYVDAAERSATGIVGRGRQVLFVGGTPLYLKALLRGMFEGPPADWQLRHQLANEAARCDAGWLHRRLAEVDPAAAARLHANDQRRIIRALEVFEKTGRPISQWQRQFEIGRPAAECRVFALDWPKAELHARMDCRVEEMFAAGLVEEVRGLLLVGPNAISARADETERNASRLETEKVPLSRTARQAVGYREVIEHLEGRHTLAKTIELVQLHTRQLAKRQMTWFRSLSECRFMPVAGPFDPRTVAERLRGTAK
ncbi:MAG: tRNA (adenosine(37)-N6)-dimethylallyltransferase MiaA [Thermoguttaceae bacterium]